jgi:D-alanyl-lipoteichoic acid acyltransferase DltB (MBOAT superfamily)
MVESINYLLNTDFEVINYFAFWSNKFGNTHFDISQIVLPVGISFYTFQTISYSVDIYRNKVTPLDNILEFGFYVSFFPQLVAGPIVRAANFIPQIRKEYNLTEEEFSYGVYLILKGLMKKMFIGDYIAVNFVDRVFANPLLHSGFENILSLYGYSLQVYCDFSGYTDIAIGIALLMGFYLPKNFNSPYKAINVGDFWRRWHISLSSWLKDYLYIPLGGNRKGPVRTNINIMLTMLLGGLWHGASWKFVTWGGLNGLGLLTWKYWRKISPYEKYNNVYSRFLKIFITFTFITFTRIWFRADNWDLSMQMLQGIFRGIDTSIIIDVMTSYYKVLLVMLLGYIIHWLPENFKVKYRDWFMDRPIYQKAILSVIVIFIIYQTYTADLQPFIYFQF